MLPPGAIAYLWVGLIPALALLAFFRKRTRYPPGPRGFPIIGNLFDVPVDFAWIEYRELARQYDSDILHFQVLGQHIVVLSSTKAVEDVLYKNSEISSDRPQNIMVDELTGWSRSWVEMGHNDQWRAHRRIFHQHFRPLAVPQYHEKQVKAAHRLLGFLLDSPKMFLQHLKFMTDALIIDVVFSFEVQPGDPIIRLVEEASETTKETVVAGVWLVDVIPILKHVPAWLPGASFKRKAAQWKKSVDNMFDIPYGLFKETLQTGNVAPCFASSLLSSVETDEELADMDEVFTSLTGTAYLAGSDTLVAALTTFVLAMVMFPEAQAAAHHALDDVLQRKRLPEISDREALPYLTALIHEIFRWHPVTPLALPHRTTADTQYEGYRIPKRSIVIGNAWAILHDETIYSEPEAFRPERFLKADGSPNEHARAPAEMFGYGRRVCPGRYFAQDALWVMIAHILTVFKIERALGENGKEVEPKADFTSFFTSWPMPFDCRFTPRFPEAADLVYGAVDG